MIEGLQDAETGSYILVLTSRVEVPLAPRHPGGPVLSRPET